MEFTFIQARGTRLRAVVRGEGPLVLMVHGFPESWYSWRHQIDPVAAAGFKVCAIDVRGYGGSQKFPKVEDYAMSHMISDILGVGDALSPDRKFILAGHDWGAPMVWNTSLIHPDRIAAVAALSVIYMGVPERSFDETIKAVFDDQNRFFYQSYFREVGRADNKFGADPKTFLERFYFTIGGEGVSGWPLDKTSADELPDILPPVTKRPDWMSAADLDYYVNEFSYSGFFGPLSRYRNHTIDWTMLQPYRDRKIEQPACFIAGDRDGAFNLFGMASDPISLMRPHVPNLEKTLVIPGCGHWTQQERPNEVNGTLIPWLLSLKGRAV
jgi:pimeloyl-ACP methyl ester carboxylesterase